MLVALATAYSYSLGEGFANGDATRFLDANGFSGYTDTSVAMPKGR